MKLFGMDKDDVYGHVWFLGVCSALFLIPLFGAQIQMHVFGMDYKQVFGMQHVFVCTILMGTVAHILFWALWNKFLMLVRFGY